MSIKQRSRNGINGDVGLRSRSWQRKQIRVLLDWVYERAVNQNGKSPGRTANKAREHLRAVVSWAWEKDVIESLPRFPQPRPQRDVAGRHYLVKSEINALYFATHAMERPRGWTSSIPVGRFCAEHWSFSSTMESIPARYGNPLRSMSQYCGGTYLGTKDRPIGRSRKSHRGVGCSIDASKPAKHFIGR